MVPKWVVSGILAFGVALPAMAGPTGLTPLQQLGKEIFMDPTLSEPAGQACMACHSPNTGFTSPSSERNGKEAIVEGAFSGRNGNRTPPSVAYASFSPKLSWNAKDKTYFGGQFRDGRSVDLVDQAKGPFLNPVEMNNPSGESVCRKVNASSYGELIATVYGGPLDCEAAGFEQVVKAIAAYETSTEVNAFSSKYDAYLKKRVQLTAQEMRGMKLYQGQAKCDQCHPSKPGPHGEAPLFTDFTYDNIGAPRNLENPFYAQSVDINPNGAAYVDSGLGATVKKQRELGKFKVPTLRNIAAGGTGFVRAYLHNGSIKGLKEVMEFYNRRDVVPNKWQPEEPLNVNRKELGNLKLTSAQEDDVIAFMQTLTDGWKE